MCWVNLEELTNIQIADKDIEVYKIVFEANKQSCKSCIQSFMYEANTIYKMPYIDIIYERKVYGTPNVIRVEKAYHSYTKIQYTLKKIDRDSTIYKGIIAGRQLMSVKFDNPYYVATFIIPKGSQYAINWGGAIISNQIIYTGKYLKL